MAPTTTKHQAKTAAKGLDPAQTPTTNASRLATKSTKKSGLVPSTGHRRSARKLPPAPNPSILRRPRPQPSHSEPTELPDIDFTPAKTRPLSKQQWLLRKPHLAKNYRRIDQIKVDYSRVLHALRPALLVLANRTLRSLEESDTWHVEGENRGAYERMVGELEAVRQRKIGAVEGRTVLYMEESLRELEGDRAVIQGRCRDQVLHYQEKALDKMEKELGEMK